MRSFFNFISRKTPETGSSSWSPLKKAVIWLTVFLLISGGVFVWHRFFSSEGREQLKYELFQRYYVEPYEKAMREDTYGGKTPEETLRLFIQALKNGDLELASKYFALNTDEKSEYYLTRRQWEEGLRKAKERGNLNEIISDLETYELQSISKELENAWFVTKSKHEILLKLNSYSGVWKIESM